MNQEDLESRVSTSTRARSRSSISRSSEARVRSRRASLRALPAISDHDVREHLYAPKAEELPVAEDAHMSRYLAERISTAIAEAATAEEKDGREEIRRRVLETYDIRTSHQYFRWNLLWLLLVLVISPMSLVALAYPSVGLALCLGLQGVLAVAFLFACYHCLSYCWKMIGAVNTPYLAKARAIDAAEVAEFRHIVMICSYKEPLDLLRTTLRSLARSTMASQIIAVVAFEAKTPQREQKIQALTEEFTSEFFALTCTTHTLLAGEIQGKCSNANHGMREGARIHLERGDLIPGRTICTSCDVDSLFHDKYFENLTYNFMTDPNRYEVVWQSPLVYNLGLDGCSVFSRVTGILRTFFMVGFLIPLNINTMSIFSTSLDMMIKGKFFHPGYQMDDIIYTLTCMRAIRKRVKIRLIEVPTVSGPTSGATWWEDVSEWRVQARRWTIGAAEVFHYFFVKLVYREFDFFSGLSYGLVLTYYYGIVLCIGQLNWICNLIVFNLVDVEGVTWGSWHVGHHLVRLTVGGVVFQYLTTYATAFFMDRLVCNVLIIEEEISLVRRIGHFLASQLVLVAYNFVELVAIFEVAWKGKKVCGHKPSNKDNLPAQKRQKNSNHSPESNGGSEIAMGETPPASLYSSEPGDILKHPNTFEEEEEHQQQNNTTDLV